MIQYQNLVLLERHSSPYDMGTRPATMDPRAIHKLAECHEKTCTRETLLPP